MNTASLIELAASHMHKGVMATSAQSCHADAVTCVAKAATSVCPVSMDQAARKWALKSLAYSLGIFSPVYQLAAAGDDERTIPRDRLFTRIKPAPGRSYYCGCDARTDGPEKCRQHDSPRVPAETVKTDELESKPWPEMEP